MSQKYFGKAKRLLEAIARRLGGTVAADGSYAVDVNGSRILYTHASFDNRKSGYCHWNWDRPFGKRGQRDIDYFLLHASKPKQTYFFIPSAERPTEGFPSEVGFQSNPIYPNKRRDKYEQFRKSIAGIKRELRQQTKKHKLNLTTFDND